MSTKITCNWTQSNYPPPTTHIVYLSYWPSFLLCWSIKGRVKQEQNHNLSDYCLGLFQIFLRMAWKPLGNLVAGTQELDIISATAICGVLGSFVDCARGACRVGGKSPLGRCWNRWWVHHTRVEVFRKNIVVRMSSYQQDFGRHVSLGKGIHDTIQHV